ncbi:MAG: elongation factor 1-beta [Candidatus Aenigmatarchaeota archaeon]
MGNVAISIRIMPASQEVDMEDLRKRIGRKIKLQDSKIELLGFGLKALKIMVVRPDTKGGTEVVEDLLRGIEGVGDVEVESATLI